MNTRWKSLGYLVSLLALLSGACMLFSRGETQPAAESEQMPGFEETLSAEIEQEVEEDETPAADQATTASPARPTGAASQPAAGQGKDWITVDGIQGFYRVNIPKTWVSSQNDSSQQICANDAGEGCLAFELRIKAADPEQMMAGYLAGLKQGVTGYQELSRQNFTIGGLPALRVDHTYIWKEKAERAFVIMTARNRVGLKMEGYGPPDRFQQVAAELSQAAGSLAWVDFPDAPLYARWRSVESSSLTLTFLPGTWIENSIQQITRDHEKAYAAVTGRLAVPGPPVHLFLYPSVTALFDSTARQSGFAITELQEVHSVWTAPDNHQTTGHELTHVITAQAIGEPQEALFGEGLAVCLDQSGRDYRAVGRELLANGQALPLEKLTGDQWFEQDSGTAYQQSGSVICYLLEQYGAARVKAAYTQDLPQALQSLGLTLAQMEQGWRAWAGGS